MAPRMVVKRTTKAETPAPKKAEADYDFMLTGKRESAKNKTVRVNRYEINRLKTPRA